MRHKIQNTAILLFFLTGWRNIWYALPFRYVDLDETILSHTFSLSLLAVHHTIYLVTGILMIVIAVNLYNRIRMAWILGILTIAISLAGHLLHIHPLSGIFITIDTLLLMVFLYGFRDYHRKSTRQSVKNASLLLLSASFIYIAYVISGIIILHAKLSQDISLADILLESVNALMFSENTLFTKHSVMATIFIDTSVAGFWLLVIFAIIVIMRPFVITPLLSRNEKSKARPIVLAYGENPMSYLALEDDKEYFFAKSVEGLCAYTTVGNVMTLCGDIICADEGAETMMQELIAFADYHHYSILMLNVTDRFKSLYETFGFGFTKCGEDACFNLSDYNLKGGAVAKVRAAINHANKAGITVNELDFESADAPVILTALEDISKQWLDAKDSPELVFMLGKNNFEMPMDRRYFYASDLNGQIIAYCVFNPYHNKKGYIAEITRRSQNAPQGALEKIIYDAFMIFKSEGSTEATLGLSPLYNVQSGKNFKISAKVFSYLYENMSTFYDFKSLHHAKEKYAPTDWKTRYYVYKPKPFSPIYAYAIIQSHLPMGISKFVMDITGSYIFRKSFGKDR